MNVNEMSKDELRAALDRARGEYELLKGRGLSLDMTRGKPSAEQLDLAKGLLAGVLLRRLSLAGGRRLS